MDETRYTLIEKVKNQQDESAWTSFSTTYNPFIKAVLLRLGINNSDTSDLQQDVLLKLWKKLPEFDYQANQGKFRTWLYQVTRNTAYSYLSSRQNESKRIETYFSSDSNSEEKNGKLDALMEGEWKSYITNLALEKIRPSFSSQSIDIFEQSLAGQTAEQLGEKYELKSNTIHRIKNRVKEKLIIEINELRRDLE